MNPDVSKWLLLTTTVQLSSSPLFQALYPPMKALDPTHRLYLGAQFLQLCCAVCCCLHKICQAVTAGLKLAAQLSGTGLIRITQLCKKKAAESADGLVHER